MLRRPRRSRGALLRTLFVCGACAVLAACATRPAVQSVAPPLAPHHAEQQRSQPRGRAPGVSGLAASPGVTGIWDWLLRSTTQQGDLRVEQEEWHLTQEGARIFGYYHRQVVTLSSDQRPFRCNGMLAFVNNTRVRLVGEIRDGGLELREVGADPDKNPCDDGSRNLTSYVGRLEGDSLSLVFASGGGQHLVRRPANSPIVPLNPDGDRQVSDDEQVQAAVDGVWDWQFRAADPEGDFHIENEEWHLDEKNDEISGYYDRTLERRRPVGVFACNGSPFIKTKTRYTVKGQRFGSKLTLTETDYQTQPGPCENRSRRLDSYQGTLLPDGQMILTWGGGQQTLRKRTEAAP